MYRSLTMAAALCLAAGAAMAACPPGTRAVPGQYMGGFWVSRHCVEISPRFIPPGPPVEIVPPVIGGAPYPGWVWGQWDGTAHAILGCSGTRSAARFAANK